MHQDVVADGVFLLSLLMIGMGLRHSCILLPILAMESHSSEVLR